MLRIGNQRQRTCQGVSRREVLQAGLSSALGLSWAGLLDVQARAAGELAGSARSVIVLWLWGGPAQLDTWDPKPDAPLEFRGPFSPIATKVTGIRIGELFPKIAAQADQFAILRSLHTGSNDHGVAGTIGLTGGIGGAVGLDGKATPGEKMPAIGSVVAKAAGWRGPLPPFMVVGGKLHQGKKAIIGEGGGPLGALYDPFRLVYDPAAGTKIPSLQLPAELTVERLGDRRKLLEAFDGLQKHTDLLRAARQLDGHREQAFTMLTSPDALKMFDVRREKPATIERYGRTRFGQSCLLARRLVEHGVPFVQVNWSDHVEAEEDAGDGGWDHHYRNFQLMQDRHAPWLDRAYSALLTDLRERGLLEKTLVVAVGEFGRSPKINPNSGRDHWEHCYSALLAGGGIQGGRVVGASDARADHPAAQPCTPADLGATIHHAIGINVETATRLGLKIEGKVIDSLF